MRWDIWLTLNAGLLTLLVGIPLVNGALILAGGPLIFIPVPVAPLIILGVPGFPGVGIEQNAPRALIYGWVLQ